MASELNIDLLSRQVKIKRGGEGLRKVAKEIDISPATLSRIEQGKVPDVDTFIKICKWLGESTDTFTQLKKRKESRMGKNKIVAHLRADKELDPEMVNIIASLIERAYNKKL